MEVRALLDVLHIAERLKDELRHCETSRGRRESVAEHSWRLALMAFFMKDEFPALDMDKVIKMCLIHDLGECFTGDIPTFLKTAEDEQKEDRVLADWVEAAQAAMLSSIIAARTRARILFIVFIHLSFEISFPDRPCRSNKKVGRFCKAIHGMNRKRNPAPAASIDSASQSFSL